MNSSAIRSSSPVVIPGCRCSPSSAIVSATSSPARAMPSISCWLFLMITVGVSAASRTGDLVASCRHLLEGGLDLREHLVLGPVSVDGDEVATCPVVLDQRLRLAVIVVEAPLDCLVGVVGTTLELGAAPQALERHLVRDLQGEDDAEAAPDVG